MTGVSEVRQSAQVTTMLLGGEERKLQYDMNAIALLEQKYGSVDKALGVLTEGSKMGEIRYILWAGLIHDQVEEFDEESGEPIKYKLKPYTVGQWIPNMIVMKDVIMKVIEAMGISTMMQEMDVEQIPNLTDEQKDLLEKAKNELTGESTTQ